MDRKKRAQKVRSKKRQSCWNHDTGERMFADVYEVDITPRHSPEKEEMNRTHNSRHSQPR